MRFNPDEHTKIVHVIDPDVQTAAAYTSAAIDTKGYEYITYIVSAGTLGSSATLDFKVTECDTSGGTYADVSGAAITQMTQAGSDSDTSVALTVRCADTERYHKGVLTVATATSDAGAVAFLSCPKVLPAV